MARVTITVEKALKDLEKSLEDIAPTVEAEINAAIADLAHAAHAEIIAHAQAQLQSTRQDYLKGVHFEDLGDNSYLISLEGEWAQKLEEGFPAYDMVGRMLKSETTVSKGSRAGQKWVQEGEGGQKYAHVPFERKIASKESKHASLADQIKQMTATNVQGRRQKITSVFKGEDGSPLTGRVATGMSKNPMLDGLVKYQETFQNNKGKEQVRSTYINFRTISENGKPWIHPGFQGIHAFERAEQKIVEQLNKILRTLL